MMEPHRTLAEIVSEVCGVPADAVRPGFRLGGPTWKGSLGKAQLDARIQRRLGIRIRDAQSLQTFDDVIRAVDGAAASSVPATAMKSRPTAPAALAPSVSRGVPLTLVDSSSPSDPRAGESPDSEPRRMAELTGLAELNSPTGLRGLTSPTGPTDPTGLLTGRGLSLSPTLAWLPAGLAPTPPPGLRCGVDIERISNIPESADPWTDPFYLQNFTKDEIAYCLLQDRPRMHFAARWCAKEALGKCDPSYAALPMNGVELMPNETGGMSLSCVGEGGVPTLLPVAVSVSHTDDVAIAMVVENPQTDDSSEGDLSSRVEENAGDGIGGGVVALLILWLAVVSVAVVALAWFVWWLG